MYLPFIGCYPKANWFGIQFTYLGEGVDGFDFPYINPDYFQPVGVLPEYQFNAFMHVVDGSGFMSVHHISKRWGASIPRSISCNDAVVFNYNGKFGMGYALAFRSGNGCANLWYILHSCSSSIPF